MSFTTTIHCHKCKKSQVCQWTTAPRGWLTVRTNYEISGGAHGDMHRVHPQPTEDHYCNDCAPGVLPEGYVKTHGIAHYFAPVPNASRATSDELSVPVPLKPIDLYDSDIDDEP